MKKNFQSKHKTEKFEPTTICLSMIVKDEAAVIERCLKSVKNLISYWIIIDTGSTDDTMNIIRNTLRAIPGELHELPWKNFGENRTEALQLSKEKAEYSLIVDADDVLEMPQCTYLPKLDQDSYMLNIKYGNTSYARTQLVKNSLNWYYEGVLHEYVTCPEAKTSKTLTWPLYHINTDGNRSTDPKKYAKDAEVLEAALKIDPTNSRNMFYLAQSYRDAGMLPSAIDRYERHIGMQGWIEETFYSYLQIAVLSERMGYDAPTVREAYLAAYRARPTRAEPLCELARYCRQHDDLALAYVFAAAAVTMRRPNDVLFVDETVYAWRALDELGISAFYAGRYKESIMACRVLLTEKRLPVSEIERVKSNLQFSLDAKD